MRMAGATEMSDADLHVADDGILAAPRTADAQGACGLPPLRDLRPALAEIAAMLEMDEAACRKLASRARQNIDHDKVRHVTPKDTQDTLLRAFQSAVMSGSTNQLAALLSSDIRLTTDTGGKTVAATRILERDDVFNALSRAHVWWEGCQWEITDMNGGRGAILKKNGQPALTISLSCTEAGLVSDIFITLNPAKLARLEPVDIR